MRESALVGSIPRKPCALMLARIIRSAQNQHIRVQGFTDLCDVTRDALDMRFVILQCPAIPSPVPLPATETVTGDVQQQLMSLRLYSADKFSAVTSVADFMIWDNSYVAITDLRARTLKADFLKLSEALSFLKEKDYFDFSVRAHERQHCAKIDPPALLNGKGCVIIRNPPAPSSNALIQPDPETAAERDPSINVESLQRLPETLLDTNRDVFPFDQTEVDLRDNCVAGLLNGVSLSPHDRPAIVPLLFADRRFPSLRVLSVSLLNKHDARAAHARCLEICTDVSASNNTGSGGACFFYSVALGDEFAHRGRYVCRLLGPGENIRKRETGDRDSSRWQGKLCLSGAPSDTRRVSVSFRDTDPRPYYFHGVLSVLEGDPLLLTAVSGYEVFLETRQSAGQERILSYLGFAPRLEEDSNALKLFRLGFQAPSPGRLIIIGRGQPQPGILAAVSLRDTAVSFDPSVFWPRDEITGRDSLTSEAQALVASLENLCFPTLTLRSSNLEMTAVSVSKRDRWTLAGFRCHPSQQVPPTEWQWPNIVQFDDPRQPSGDAMSIGWDLVVGPSPPLILGRTDLMLKPELNEGAKRSLQQRKTEDEILDDQDAKRRLSALPLAFVNDSQVNDGLWVEERGDVEMGALTRQAGLLAKRAFIEGDALRSPPWDRFDSGVGDAETRRTLLFQPPLQLNLRATRHALEYLNKERVSIAFRKVKLRVWREELSLKGYFTGIFQINRNSFFDDEILFVFHLLESGNPVLELGTRYFGSAGVSGQVLPTFGAKDVPFDFNFSSPLNAMELAFLERTDFRDRGFKLAACNVTLANIVDLAYSASPPVARPLKLLSACEDVEIAEVTLMPSVFTKHTPFRILEPSLPGAYRLSPSPALQRESRSLSGLDAVSAWRATFWASGPGRQDSLVYALASRPLRSMQICFSNDHPLDIQSVTLERCLGNNDFISTSHELCTASAACEWHTSGVQSDRVLDGHALMEFRASVSVTDPPVAVYLRHDDQIVLLPVSPLRAEVQTIMDANCEVEVGPDMDPAVNRRQHAFVLTLSPPFSYRQLIDKETWPVSVFDMSHKESVSVVHIPERFPEDDGKFRISGLITDAINSDSYVTLTVSSGAQVKANCFWDALAIQEDSAAAWKFVPRKSYFRNISSQNDKIAGPLTLTVQDTADVVPANLTPAVEASSATSAKDVPVAHCMWEDLHGKTTTLTYFQSVPFPPRVISNATAFIPFNSDASHSALLCHLLFRHRVLDIIRISLSEYSPLEGEDSAPSVMSPWTTDHKIPNPELKVSSTKLAVQDQGLFGQIFSGSLFCPVSAVETQFFLIADPDNDSKIRELECKSEDILSINDPSLPKRFVITAGALPLFSRGAPSAALAMALPGSPQLPASATVVSPLHNPASESLLVSIPRPANTLENLWVTQSLRDSRSLHTKLANVARWRECAMGRSHQLSNAFCPLMVTIGATVVATPLREDWEELRVHFVTTAAEENDIVIRRRHDTSSASIGFIVHASVSDVDPRPSFQSPAVSLEFIDRLGGLYGTSQFPESVLMEYQLQGLGKETEVASVPLPVRDGHALFVLPSTYLFSSPTFLHLRVSLVPGETIHENYLELVDLATSVQEAPSHWGTIGDMAVVFLSAASITTDTSTSVVEELWIGNEADPQIIDRINIVSDISTGFIPGSASGAFLFPVLNIAPNVALGRSPLRGVSGAFLAGDSHPRRIVYNSVLNEKPDFQLPTPVAGDGSCEALQIVPEGMVAEAGGGFIVSLKLKGGGDIVAGIYHATFVPLEIFRLLPDAEVSLTRLPQSPFKYVWGVHRNGVFSLCADLAMQEGTSTLASPSQTVSAQAPPFDVLRLLAQFSRWWPLLLQDEESIAGGVIRNERTKRNEANVMGARELMIKKESKTAVERRDGFVSHWECSWLHTNLQDQLYELYGFGFVQEEFDLLKERNQNGLDHFIPPAVWSHIKSRCDCDSTNNLAVQSWLKTQMNSLHSFESIYAEINEDKNGVDRKATQRSICWEHSTPSWAEMRTALLVVAAESSKSHFTQLKKALMFHGLSECLASTIQNAVSFNKTHPISVAVSALMSKDRTALQKKLFAEEKLRSAAIEELIADLTKLRSFCDAARNRLFAVSHILRNTDLILQESDFFIDCHSMQSDPILRFKAEPSIADQNEFKAAFAQNRTNSISLAELLDFNGDGQITENEIETALDILGDRNSNNAEISSTLWIVFESLSAEADGERPRRESFPVPILQTFLLQVFGFKAEKSRESNLGLSSLLPITSHLPLCSLGYVGWCWDESWSILSRHMSLASPKFAAVRPVRGSSQVSVSLENPAPSTVNGIRSLVSVSAEQSDVGGRFSATVALSELPLVKNGMQLSVSPQLQLSPVFNSFRPNFGSSVGFKLKTDLPSFWDIQCSEGSESCGRMLQLLRVEFQPYEIRVVLPFSAAIYLTLSSFFQSKGETGDFREKTATIMLSVEQTDLLQERHMTTDVILLFDFQNPEVSSFIVSPSLSPSPSRAIRASPSLSRCPMWAPQYLIPVVRECVAVVDARNMSPTLSVSSNAVHTQCCIKDTSILGLQKLEPWDAPVSYRKYLCTTSSISNDEMQCNTIVQQTISGQFIVSWLETASSDISLDLFNLRDQSLGHLQVSYVDGSLVWDPFLLVAQGSLMCQTGGEMKMVSPLPFHAQLLPSGRLWDLSVSMSPETSANVLTALSRSPQPAEYTIVVIISLFGSRVGPVSSACTADVSDVICLRLPGRLELLQISPPVIELTRNPFILDADSFYLSQRLPRVSVDWMLNHPELGWDVPLATGVSADTPISVYFGERRYSGQTLRAELFQDHRRLCGESEDARCPILDLTFQSSSPQRIGRRLLANLPHQEIFQLVTSPVVDSELAIDIDPEAILQAIFKMSASLSRQQLLALVQALLSAPSVGHAMLYSSIFANNTRSLNSLGFDVVYTLLHDLLTATGPLPRGAVEALLRRLGRVLPATMENGSSFVIETAAEASLRHSLSLLNRLTKLAALINRVTEAIVDVEEPASSYNFNMESADFVTKFILREGHNVVVLLDPIRSRIECQLHDLSQTETPTAIFRIGPYVHAVPETLNLVPPIIRSGIPVSRRLEAARTRVSVSINATQGHELMSRISKMVREGWAQPTVRPALVDLVSLQMITSKDNTISVWDSAIEGVAPCPYSLEFSTSQPDIIEGTLDLDACLPNRAKTLVFVLDGYRLAGLIHPMHYPDRQRLSGLQNLRVSCLAALLSISCLFILQRLTTASSILQSENSRLRAEGFSQSPSQVFLRFPQAFVAYVADFSSIRAFSRTCQNEVQVALSFAPSFTVRLLSSIRHVRRWVMHSVNRALDADNTDTLLWLQHPRARVQCVELSPVEESYFFELLESLELSKLARHPESGHAAEKALKLKFFDFQLGVSDFIPPAPRPSSREFFSETSLSEAAIENEDEGRLGESAPDLNSSAHPMLNAGTVTSHVCLSHQSTLMPHLPAMDERQLLDLVIFLGADFVASTLSLYKAQYMTFSDLYGNTKNREQLALKLYNHFTDHSFQLSQALARILYVSFNEDPMMLPPEEEDETDSPCELHRWHTPENTESDPLPASSVLAGFEASAFLPALKPLGFFKVGLRCESQSCGVTCSYLWLGPDQAELCFISESEILINLTNESRDSAKADLFMLATPSFGLITIPLLDLDCCLSQVMIGDLQQVQCLRLQRRSTRKVYQLFVEETHSPEQLLEIERLIKASIELLAIQIGLALERHQSEVLPTQQLGVCVSSPSQRQPDLDRWQSIVHPFDVDKLQVLGSDPVETRPMPFTATPCLVNDSGYSNAFCQFRNNKELVLFLQVQAPNVSKSPRAEIPDLQPTTTVGSLGSPRTLSSSLGTTASFTYPTSIDHPGSITYADSCALPLHASAPDLGTGYAHSEVEPHLIGRWTTNSRQAVSGGQGFSDRAETLTASNTCSSVVESPNSHSAFTFISSDLGHFTDFLSFLPIPSSSSLEWGGRLGNQSLHWTYIPIRLVQSVELLEPEECAPQLAAGSDRKSLLQLLFHSSIRLRLHDDSVIKLSFPSTSMGLQAFVNLFEAVEAYEAIDRGSSCWTKYPIDFNPPQPPVPTKSVVPKLPLQPLRDRHLWLTRYSLNRPLLNSMASLSLFFRSNTFSICLRFLRLKSSFLKPRLDPFSIVSTPMQPCISVQSAWVLCASVLLLKAHNLMFPVVQTTISVGKICLLAFIGCMMMELLVKHHSWTPPTITHLANVNHRSYYIFLKFTEIARALWIYTFAAILGMIAVIILCRSVSLTALRIFCINSLSVVVSIFLGFWVVFPLLKLFAFLGIYHITKMRRIWWREWFAAWMCEAIQELFHCCSVSRLSFPAPWPSLDCAVSESPPSHDQSFQGTDAAPELPTPRLIKLNTDTDLYQSPMNLADVYETTQTCQL
eukprot:Gregarina_sp_Poly_1__11290@NODE_93_length_14707_cov_13_644945_g80_i0_p1_GENE_NODE_93_length_14707_cov_13_644945_g80_i0NODE_93_length_14707_cov_13_644945_g80_i0_p1_ORF_typecomplete_len4871_score680_58EFhand_6/PF13405_6/6_7e03EFhand_6/PF13405_6/0_0058_NODE_93_length_14707_cov_13_644945_g80_i09413368